MDSDTNSVNDNLSVSMIEDCKPKDLIKLSKDLKITDFADMCELKQKIILETMKKKESVINSQFYTDDFKNIKSITLKEDDLRRKYLKKYIDLIEEIYLEIQKLDKIRCAEGVDITERDDPLKLRIVNEFPNIEEHIQNKKILVMKKPRCSLLICGDSGAGKSSFINLLVNKDVLPVSIRCNTACQVRLTYGDNEYAEVIDLENKPEKIKKEDFKNKLKNCLQNFGSNRTFSLNSATIHLKSSVLEGGLDIYDTIGLGESKLFDEKLTKDLKDITGVLFLLKKNNPIGDETVGGLSKVINHIAKNGIPGSSMHFIINMCDQLDKKDDKKELKKNVKEQIREKCGGLNPEITTFSTKQELFLQSQHFMSKDYQNIMTLIQNLHINSINTNTVSIFELLFRFTCKSINFIAESETFTEDDRISKRKYINKLKNLEEDRKTLNTSFKNQNEMFLKKKYGDYKSLIISHFNDRHVKAIIRNEVVSSQSTLFGMTEQEKIDNEIMELTHNSILKNFKEYVEKDGLLSKCCEEMLQMFFKQYAEYQKKKHEIDEEVTSHIKTTMIDMDNLKMRNFNDLLGLPGEQRTIFTLFAPIVIPIIEITTIIKSGLQNWFSWISSKINMSNVQRFYEDTTAYVSDKSIQYYNKFFSKNRNIKMIMDSLFFAPRQVAKDFENYLEDDMGYLAKNINLLDEDMRKKDSVIRTYKNIKDRLIVIEEELCKFYLLYLQKDKYNVMNENIEIDDNASVLQNRNRIVYNGHFKRTQETDSAILVYKTSNEKTFKQFYLEFLKHKEILNIKRSQGNLETMKCFMEIRFHILLSFEDKTNVSPMFLVNGIDYSLKKYIDENRTELKQNDKKLYEEIRRLLRQILEGLIYLHKQKPPLNHYDLTLDSIGYNCTYRAIKLSSISFSTHVKVDNVIKCQNYVINMSHFPVQLLENDNNVLYTSQTDIYCLGTVLFYLWTGINPFFDVILNEKIFYITQFIDLVKCSKFHNIVVSNMFSPGFGDMIFTWCTLCWEKNFTAEMFLSNLTQQLFYGEVLH